MSPFIPLLTLYALITIGSASVLFFSFKEQVDTSGKYFLLGELSMLPVLIQVILVNLYPNLAQYPVFFLGNLFYIISEISILLSIYALTNIVRRNQYWVAIAIAIAYSIFIEFCRINIDPKLPFLLLPLSSIGLAIATYIACKKCANNELQSNLFLKWFGYLEIALTCIAVIRSASYFSDTPISPRSPTISTLLIFTVFSALNIFRYITYQSIRISWIDPRSSVSNFLNKTLVKVVDEKNQLLDELISSNRAIGISALASSLAHQLSQPLTGINLQVELLKRSAFDPIYQEYSKKLLNDMGKELEDLSALVKNLRLLFEDSSSKYEHIELTKISDAILAIIEPTLRVNHINLKTSYLNRPIVMGNVIQLQQVLINIFNNAIQAINTCNPRVREISLEISQIGENAILTVLDSGPGISQSMLKNIFELYKSTKKDGLGVGLWLSKTIIQKHNGDIRAINISEGALFEIQIPLATS